MISLLPFYRTTVTPLYGYTIRFMAGGYDPSRGRGCNDSIISSGSSKLEAVREEEFLINKQNDLMRKLKSRRITLHEYHIKRLKVLEEYTRLLRKWRLK